jgi:hypothetical protein
MLTAIAVPFELIPLELIRPHKLAQQIHVYDDWIEFRFHFAAADSLLPIVHEGGRITLARWGCRREECRVLPCTGWTTAQGATSRFWPEVGGRTVTMPAYLGYEDGAWVPLRSQGRAVLAYDSRGQPHAFVVCELSTHCVLRGGVVSEPSIYLRNSEDVLGYFHSADAKSR